MVSRVEQLVDSNWLVHTYQETTWPLLGNEVQGQEGIGTLPLVAVNAKELHSGSK